MKEPLTPTPRPCSIPHSAPAAWLQPRATPESAPDQADLRAAIELVLASPEALAEIIGRAPPTAFARHAAAGGSTRHDGWTGERMATFLEVLADTGIVTEGSRAAGISRESAYALRNRDPVFAAAWRAAESKARPQVSDGLLERSITGTVEHYYRDGVLVGERRHYESWLGLAVLKRLDKLAEEDRAEGSLSARMAGDWQGTLEMLRSAGTGGLPPAFAPKVDKVDTPPSPPGCDPWENVWRADDGTWMTCFPPPPGFQGRESGSWDGINWYERECSEEECALLDANEVAVGAQDLADAEAQRGEWFTKISPFSHAAADCGD